MDNDKRALFSDVARYWKTRTMASLYLSLFIVACAFAGVALFSNAYIAVALAFVYFFVAWRLFVGFVALARLNAESAVKSKETGAVIQYLNDGVIVYDQNYTVLEFNKAAERIFGVPAAEVVGRRFDPSVAKVPRYRVLAQTLFPSLAPSLNQLSDAGTWPQIADIVFDEPKLELHATLNPVKDASGKNAGFIKIVHDSTREKGLMRAKTDFIGVAAHQLRTPLTALHWATENLVKMTEKDPDVHAIAAEAFAVAERAVKITNDLLDVSKIEEGKFGYVFAPADLSALVASVAEEAKTHAKQFGVSLEYAPSPIPLPEVSIDANKLKAALFNIVDNAIRYNEENGKVAIAVAPLPNGKFARIAVSDTGIGMSKEDAAKLFTKLWRGSNAVQVEPNGTGLGLYIARNIVRRHGGDIAVATELHRGSTFSITVPLDPALVPKYELAMNEL